MDEQPTEEESTPRKITPLRVLFVLAAAGMLIFVFSSDRMASVVGDGGETQRQSAPQGTIVSSSGTTVASGWEKNVEGSETQTTLGVRVQVDKIFVPSNGQGVGINTSDPHGMLHVNGITVLNGTVNITAGLFVNGSEICTPTNGLCPDEDTWLTEKTAYNTTSDLFKQFFNITDQRYNESARISLLNTSGNIELLGFNRTTDLTILYDSRYATAAGLASVNETKLNVTDQRFNETTRISLLNTSANFKLLGFNTTDQLDLAYILKTATVCYANGTNCPAGSTYTDAMAAAAVQNSTIARIGSVNQLLLHFNNISNVPPFGAGNSNLTIDQAAAGIQNTTILRNNTDIKGLNINATVKMGTPELCLAHDCRTAWPTSGSGSADGGILRVHTNRSMNIQVMNSTDINVSVNMSEVDRLFVGQTEYAQLDTDATDDLTTTNRTSYQCTSTSDRMYNITLSGGQLTGVCGSDATGGSGSGISFSHYNWTHALQTTTSNTAYTTMNVTIPNLLANSRYQIDCDIVHDAAAATTGLVINVTFSGATSGRATWTSPSSATAIETFTGTSVTSAGNNFLDTGSATAAAVGNLDGWIITGASAVTWKVDFRSEVSGSAVNVREGTFCRAVKVA